MFATKWKIADSISAKFRMVIQVYPGSEADSGGISGFTGT